MGLGGVLGHDVETGFSAGVFVTACVEEEGNLADAEKVASSAVFFTVQDRAEFDVLHI